MRWVNRLITVAALLSISAVAAVAQTAECNDEFTTTMYSKWYDNREKAQDVAYEATVEYFKVCTNPPADNPYAKAMKTFKEKYEALKATNTVANQFNDAVAKKNNPEIIRLGKQIVATTPDNAVVYIYMATAGIDANMLNEAAQAAKKGIELIEAGKPFAPAYNSKDMALASLNYVVAKTLIKSTPADAIPYFLKSVRYESDVKKNWQIYFELADAYEKGPVAKLTAEYKSKLGPDNTETPESKLVFENLLQMLDRQIDAQARAAALNPDAANKKALTEDLTALYKYRYKGSTDGFEQMMASILTKPVPDLPTPITVLPTPAPTSTPTPTTNTSTGTNGGGNTGSAPGSTAGSNSRSIGPVSTGTGKTNTSATGAPSSPGAKPSPTPKPKPRRSNHRSH